MTLQRNHYEVLGVPRKATTDEIKKKYRELARKFHPDIAQDKDMGQKIFSQINQAYHVLGDPDRRAQYDAAQAADAFAAPARSSNGTNNGTNSGASASAPPSAQSAANIMRLLSEAETAMLQNNVGKVRTICELILKSDPRHHKALILMGDALAQMGRPQEAATAYRQALQVAPSAALQAKLNRLVGPPVNGNGTQARPATGVAPRPTPPPPPTFNGQTGNGNSKAGQTRTDQGRTPTDQGRAEKSSGGLLSRLLGRK